MSSASGLSRTDVRSQQSFLCSVVVLDLCEQQLSPGELQLPDGLFLGKPTLEPAGTREDRRRQAGRQAGRQASKQAGRQASMQAKQQRITSRAKSHDSRVGGHADPAREPEDRHQRR